MLWCDRRKPKILERVGQTFSIQIMKILFFLGAFFLFHSTFIYAQSGKNEKLLQTGIESDDPIQIANALTSGAKPNDGLRIAVNLDNLKYVKYFLSKGADPSLVLNFAVSKNNINVVDYLIEKGAKFLSDTSYIVNNPSKIIDFDNPKNPIPITLKRINGEDCWLMKNESDANLWKDGQKKENLYLEYTIKDTVMANNSMISAIYNNNLEMINLLIEHGINPRSYCFSKYLFIDSWRLKRERSVPYHEYYEGPLYDDYYKGSIRDVEATIDGKKVLILSKNRNGVFLSRFTPFLPLIMRPIEYAIYINANKEILDALLLYDSIPNYKFNIKYVPCIKDNSKISDQVVNTFDYGFTLDFKVKNDNVFGYKLLYSIDNKTFREIKDVTFSADSINNGVNFKESSTHYYYNMFADSIHPKSVVLKIILKEYGVLIDKNDGEQYKTVKIGDQVLMAENIRRKADNGCWSGTNKSYTIKKNGYLYNWETANEIGIEGWHVPSIDEWVELFEDMGGNSQFRLHKINGGFYRSEDDGIDCAVNLMQEGGSSGFNLVLSGSRTIYGVNEGFGKCDMFWSSTDHWDFFLFSEVQWLRGFNAYKYNAPKKCGCSVRLFKNK